MVHEIVVVVYIDVCSAHFQLLSVIWARTCGVLTAMAVSVMSKLAV